MSSLVDIRLRYDVASIECVVRDVISRYRGVPVAAGTTTSAFPSESQQEGARECLHSSLTAFSTAQERTMSHPVTALAAVAVPAPGILL